MVSSCALRVSVGTPWLDRLEGGVNRPRVVTESVTAVAAASSCTLAAGKSIADAVSVAVVSSGGKGSVLEAPWLGDNVSVANVTATATTSLKACSYLMLSSPGKS